MSVSLTFPDGSVRDYDAAMTGAGLAESISKSLAKKAVAYSLDGVLRDLSDPLGKSGNVEIVTRDDPRALELIRHDTAHVLAEAVQGGIRVSQFNVERILKAFLPKHIPETFEELRIPLKVTATDYFGHKLAVFSEGELHSALAASAAIPAVFRPVIRDDRLLIDGGIYNPVPFDLIADEADIVIAVDVVGAPSDAERRHPTSVDLMYGATQLMMQSIIANKLAQCQPHVLVRPAVSKYRVLDFLKIDALMSETVAIKDELKREVERAVEAVAKGARQD